MTNKEASTLLVPIRNDYQHLADTEENEIAVALYKTYVEALGMAIDVLGSSQYGQEEENQPHEVCELMCLKCLNRWIGVFPENVLLKDIECKCGQIGYVIKTGQTLEDI